MDHIQALPIFQITKLHNSVLIIPPDFFASECPQTKYSNETVSPNKTSLVHRSP